LQETRDTDSEVDIDFLVKGAVSRNADDFGRLYDLYIDRVYRHVYYRTGNVKDAEDSLQKDLEDRDMIQDVQNDVMIWARKKTREISQLRQLEKYRREFLGNVSHELKTPIFNIQGYILTLLDGGLEDEKVNRLYLERTEKSVNRLCIKPDITLPCGRGKHLSAQHHERKYNRIPVCAVAKSKTDLMQQSMHLRAPESFPCFHSIVMI